MPVNAGVTPTALGGGLLCRTMLVLLLAMCTVADRVAAASGEVHQPEVAQRTATRRGDVFTSSYLVRFHRSVDGQEAQHVAIRNGFENVGAVSAGGWLGGFFSAGV